jgi:hypothetical protein
MLPLCMAAAVSAPTVLLVVNPTSLPTSALPASRSTKEDLSFDSWLEQLAELQRGYRALVARQGAGPQDYWQLLKQWDGVQMFWFVPLRSMWKVTYTRWAAGAGPEHVANWLSWRQRHVSAFCSAVSL